jgi:peptide/nickel transport system permease protein
MTEATEVATPFGGPRAFETELPPRSPSQLFWRRFRRDWLAMGAVGFLVLLILIAIFAPLVVSALGLPGPNERDPSARGDFGEATGPSPTHPFGVDDAGRDVASRVIYGARISLIVAFLATGIATMLGVVSGVLAGYRGGWVDTVISRSVDVLLAIPYLLLATGIAASCSVGDGCLGGLLKPGLGVVIFVIAFTSWTYIARIVRGETLSIREREFVEAARAAGASDRVILFREILPNLVAPIIVYASVLIPQVILYEAALSFLGVGVASPTASWGQMISDATGVFPDAWWYMFFPGMALVLTVIAFNIVGDALQDALNPKASRNE